MGKVLRNTILFGGLGLLSLGSSAFAQSYDPIKDFCRRASHQAAVVGDKLYIDGGNLNLAGKGGRNYTNTRLLYHDLTTVARGETDLGMPPMYANLTKPGSVPSVLGGYLWNDQANGKFYLFGGEYPVGTPADSFALWMYDTWYDNWTSIAADNTIQRASYGAGTTIEHLGKGYYLGGWQSERNLVDWEGPRKATNTLLVYDMVANNWRNQTGPEDGLGRAEGVMNYIPAGDGGMLIYFGGVHLPNGKEESFKPAPMNQVDIYDITNDHWYKQNTTGTIPELRRRFCGGVAIAQDNSSYNIYIYGGMGFGNQTDGFDDVYILSIPSFKWIKAYPLNDRPDSEAFPHYDLTCNVVNNSQMLIIGGTFPKDMDVKNCDAQGVQGVHNLVMGKQNAEKVFWGRFQPNLTTYEVPKEILDVIGGEPTGAAKLKVPEQGFGHNDLQTLFTRVVSPKTRMPTRTPEPKPGSEKKDNKAAIIGGAVGGGIALIAAIAFIVFCVRKKRNGRRVDPQVQQEALRENFGRGPRAPGLQVVTPGSVEMSQPPMYGQHANFPPTGFNGSGNFNPNNSFQGSSPPSSPSNLYATPSTPGGYGTYSSAHSQSQGQFPGGFPPPLPGNNLVQQYPYPGPPATPVSQSGYYDAMQMPVNQSPAEAPGYAPVELPLTTSPPPKIFPFIPPPQRDDGDPRQ